MEGFVKMEVITPKNKNGMMLIFLTFLLTSFVSSGIVGELTPQATINNGIVSPNSDITSGVCRTVIFNTNYGDIKIQACEKDPYLELYRQEYPQGVNFQACLSNICINQATGFAKMQINELTASPPTSQPPSSQPTTETPPTNPPTNNDLSADYAIQMSGIANNGKTYSQIFEEWNDATWEDIVDDSFSNQGNLAAVRWYNTEGQCTGDKCQDQLHNGNGAFNELDIANKKFGGVTDEFSNVLLNFAMGLNKDRYDKLHRFSEKLRLPNANNLQCWKYYVTGKKDYNNYNDVCVSSDSASDASIRILGAYAISCAKQKAGIWSSSDINYCADYEKQGRAIFGFGTQNHGEVKIINGKYYLANGYNNQVGSPTAYQSFRPDYYELQFLMDFAKYMNSQELQNGVLDMLDTYYNSLGDNMIHKGKTGKFNSDGSSGYVCTDLCNPEYLDNIDSWRAIPALSGLYNIHGTMIPQEKKEMFDYWWNNYVKPYSTSFPFEIYSNSASGKVKSMEGSYKTLSMWIPLASTKDKSFAKNMIEQLIGTYRADQKQFSGAAYYGGYFSQFAQRALGSGTGAINPAYWFGENLAKIENPSQDTSNPPTQNTPTLNESLSDTPNNTPPVYSETRSSSNSKNKDTTDDVAIVSNQEAKQEIKQEGITKKTHNITKDTEEKISKGDQIIFKIKGEEYVLIVEEIRSDEIILKLEDSELKFSIKADKKNRLNLDEGRSGDLTIEILNIEENSAEVRFIPTETFIKRSFQNIDSIKEFFIHLIGIIAVAIVGIFLHKGAL
jgi:hypothetical protein